MSIQEDKISNLLGLAQRSGKIASGDFAARTAVTSGKAACLLVADDASSKASSEYSKLAERFGIPIFRVLDKERMGHAIGADMRAVVTVLDKGFAEAIESLIPAGEGDAMMR